MERPVEVLTKAMADQAARFGWSFKPMDDAATWVSVGPHQVMLVALPPDLDEASKAIADAKERAYDHWILAGQAAITNMAMFCTVADETATTPPWQSFAAEVERDEMVCRKLVWLSGRDTVEKFLNRTMLARPWEKVMVQGPEQLKALGEELAVPNAWMELLSQDDLEGTDLIEALLALPESVS